MGYVVANHSKSKNVDREANPKEAGGKVQTRKTRASVDPSHETQ